MSRRYRTQLIFGVVAAVAIGALFLVLQTTTTWPWYYTWPLAATVVAFFTYAMDKGMAKANTVRVPEVVLHLLALGAAQRLHACLLYTSDAADE